MTEEQKQLREELIGHLAHRPFQPFIIVMADGSRFDIVRPFQAAVGETRGYLVTRRRKGESRFSNSGDSVDRIAGDGMRKTVDHLLAAEPFVPFIFVMSSGDRYQVHDSRMAVIERDVITIYRPRSDRKDVLRLAEISSVEVLDSEE